VTGPELLARCRLANRLALCGGPRTGKSTLATMLGRDGRSVLHTDALIGLGWSEASAEAMRLANETRGRIVIEGVAVPRALRKGLKVDLVVWLERAWEPLSPGQASMTKACRTVLDEWRRANPQVPFIEVPNAPAVPPA
jgi:hypothetical protein